LYQGRDRCGLLGFFFCFSFANSRDVSRDADLDAKVASTEESPAVSVKAVEADAPTVLGGQRALEERIDAKKWTLWASLVLGVAFLGWMAWRLLKQMNAATKPGTRGPDATS